MVQSASDLIAQRSPGIRTRAIMGKGKLKGEPPVRFARALPRVREAGGFDAPPLAAGAAQPDAFAALPSDAAPVITAPAAAAIIPAAVNPGDNGGWFLFTPVPGPGIIGGGPGGGIVIVQPPGPEEPGPPVVPPPPAPAVPEPGIWAMLLFGFGALGYGLRRKRHGRLITA